MLDALTSLPGLDDRSDVVRASTQLLAATTDPAAQDPLPASTGSCVVPIVWTAADYPALDALADATGWPRPQVAEAAGSFIVAVVLALIGAG